MRVKALCWKEQLSRLSLYELLRQAQMPDREPLKLACHASVLEEHISFCVSELIRRLVLCPQAVQ